MYSMSTRICQVFTTLNLKDSSWHTVCSSRQSISLLLAASAVDRHNFAEPRFMVNIRVLGQNHRVNMTEVSGLAQHNM